MDQTNSDSNALLQKSKVLLQEILSRPPTSTSTTTNETDQLKTNPLTRTPATSAQLITDRKLLKLYKAIDMAG